MVVIMSWYLQWKETNFSCASCGNGSKSRFFYERPPPKWAEVSSYRLISLCIINEYYLLASSVNARFLNFWWKIGVQIIPNRWNDLLLDDLEFHWHSKFEPEVSAWLGDSGSWGFHVQFCLASNTQVGTAYTLLALIEQFALRRSTREIICLLTDTVMNK